MGRLEQHLLWEEPHFFDEFVDLQGKTDQLLDYNATILLNPDYVDYT